VQTPSCAAHRVAAGCEAVTRRGIPGPCARAAHACSATACTLSPPRLRTAASAPAAAGYIYLAGGVAAVTDAGPASPGPARRRRRRAGSRPRPGRARASSRRDGGRRATRAGGPPAASDSPAARAALLSFSMPPRSESRNSAGKGIPLPPPCTARASGSPLMYLKLVRLRLKPRTPQAAQPCTARALTGPRSLGVRKCGGQSSCSQPLPAAGTDNLGSQLEVSHGLSEST
jgi:hypothetical protein